MEKVWQQQSVFAEMVKEFCRKNGLLTPRGAVKMEETADLFDLNTDTLRQFLYDSTRRRPHLDTLSHIASVIGCSVADFLDSPNDPPPAVSQGQWAGLGERERALVVSLIADFSTEGLSLAEREELCRLFREAKDRMLRLREAWAAGPRSPE